MYATDIKKYKKSLKLLKEAKYIYTYIYAFQRKEYQFSYEKSVVFFIQFFWGAGGGWYH